MAEDHVENYALFVGSAHRPNVTGFLDTLGSRLGYLPENSEIFLAGGVGQSIRNTLMSEDRIYGEFFWNRARDWGQVSNSMLTTLIDRANCILLPITSGGGSNLKTAEAILSGRPIVATQHAFRGFEGFTDLPHVYVCDSVESFQSTVTRLVSEGYIPTDTENTERRQSVVWENCLAQLPEWFDLVLTREGESS